MDFLAKLLQGSWSTLQEMAPYLILGFFVAGVISVVIPVSWVRRHLNGRGLGPIVKSAAAGVPLPLCSCGVIPVAASLRRAGSGPGATTAFLLATPQTGVDSILVMAGMLGAGFALFSPLAALVSGIAAGLLVQRFGGPFPELEEEPEAGAAGGQPLPAWQRIFRHGFIVLCKDIARPLLIGILLAGLLSAIIPPSFFEGRSGSGIGVKLLLLFAGIPLYVCAAASVPIAASLVVAGVSPGGALVFLMSGPATNAATVTVLLKIIGRRGTAVYFIGVAAMTLLCGVLLDLLLSQGAWPAVHTHHDMDQPAWRGVVAVLFVAWLVYVRYLRKPGK